MIKIGLGPYHHLMSPFSVMCPIILTIVLLVSYNDWVYTVVIKMPFQFCCEFSRLALCQSNWLSVIGLGQVCFMHLTTSCKTGLTYSTGMCLQFPFVDVSLMNKLAYQLGFSFYCPVQSSQCIIHRCFQTSINDLTMIAVRQCKTEQLKQTLCCSLALQRQPCMPLTDNTFCGFISFKSSL